MRIRIPFGARWQELVLGENVDTYRCSFPAPLSDNQIRQSIEEGICTFGDLLDQDDVVCVINDGFRRTPTGKLLSFLKQYLGRWTFLVATGCHRPATTAELAEILGGWLNPIGGRLHQHDCQDRSGLVNLGRTSRGTPVLLNRKVVDAPVIFAINSVEPHFFAGFTGGRKSIVPGLAGLETIRINHALAKEEQAMPCVLDTNPLHQDLYEGLRLLADKTILTIQCVTDRQGRIVDLHMGRLSDCFAKAVSSSRCFHTVIVPRKYDLVIAVSEPPLDRNLYQLQKAQEHGALMVRDGGVLVVVGECREGVGPEYFLRLAEKYATPKKVLAMAEREDGFGIHKLVRTARQLERFRIFYVTSLDQENVRKVYFEAFDTVQQAVDEALGILGMGATVAVLWDAGYTVPRVAS